jgi:hypothetical protein
VFRGTVFQRIISVGILILVLLGCRCANSWGKFWDVGAAGASERSWSFATGVLNWPDTGEASCFNTTAIIPCTGTGGTFPQQDGDYLTLPAARSLSAPSTYTNYPDDWVTSDATTGLIWQTCTYGLSGANCATGTALLADFDTAPSLCSSLNAANNDKGYAGRKNWRLPVRSELGTLQDLGGSIPLIDATKFPATISGHYWTSTTQTTNGWFIEFADSSSISNNESKATTNAVRCVSTGD